MGQKSINLKNMAKENSNLTEHISKTEEKNNENNSKSKKNVQKKKISRENKTQIREFLDFLEFEKGSSKNTITGYNRDLLQFFLFAQKNFSEIEEKDIFEYIENLNEKLRRNSVLRKVSALKTFYKFCYLNKDVEKDPTGMIKTLKREQRLPEILTLKEMKQIVDNCPHTPEGMQNKLIIKILIATGARISETLNLEIKDVMAKLKIIAPKTEVIETIFVTNEKKELVGEADLRDILISSEDTKLENIMDENVKYVYVEEDQEEVARIVSKYDLRVVPVINHKKNILGIITVDDIIDVIQEENTEDILKLGGVSEEEEIDSPFLFSVKQRLPWLVINLATAFLASFVIGLFSNTVEKVVILSSIMTIISGMGGNAGTQALSVTIRALALGEVDLKDTIGIIGKTLLVGAINGAILGLLCGGILWILYGNFYMGLIVFLAMIGNLVIACMIGFLIPITLKALKIDPAMASAVVLTTATDCFGFLIFLSLATVFLNKLT